MLKKEEISETTFEGPISFANLEVKGQKCVFKKLLSELSAHQSGSP